MIGEEGLPEVPGSADAERRVVYCVVPAELADQLHEPLQKHFRDDQDVEVIVERRAAERRRAGDRRTTEGKPPGASERREIRAEAGRRIADRRARLVAASEAPPLPRRARRHAERIAFVERLEPSGQEMEDRDTARIIARVQAGDSEAFGIVYKRYYDRVYAYLRTALRDSHEAEDRAQEVFVKVLEGLPRYERRKQPFRAWLFVLVRNEAISELRRAGRLEVEDPATIERRREDVEDVEDERAAEVLDWITDRDVMVFVQRLPPQSKQILVMRYLMDMNSVEIAASLNTTPDAVRSTQRRALDNLRVRLSAVREPKRISPPKMQRWRKQDVVLRNRRYALVKNK